MNQICVLFGSALTGLFIFLLLQPSQGGTPKFGINLQIYDGYGRCFHIHHWMYLFFLVTLISATIVACGGKFTNPIVALIGFMIGASFSDLVYCDSCKIKGDCKPNL